jgi:hypothetical protein
VFNGAAPRISTTLTMVGEEARAWSMSGAKGIALLASHDVADNG